MDGDCGIRRRPSQEADLAEVGNVNVAEVGTVDVGDFGDLWPSQ